MLERDRGHASRLGCEPEQNVLAADVRLAESARLLGSETEVAVGGRHRYLRATAQ